jgi:hypothetical protein
MTQRERLVRLAQIHEESDHHAAEFARLGKELEELLDACEHTTADGESALDIYPAGPRQTVTDCTVCGWSTLTLST